MKIVNVKIHTDYDPPPIPLRQFDWSAWYDNSEGECEHGRTEQEAIDNLLEHRPPQCLDCDGEGGILPGIECATCEGTGVRMKGDPHNPIMICKHL
jgi:hypothetical protein